VKDHIRYDILAQDALRSVIRKVLSEVAATGSLPGDHHFFITFLTNAPGVRISVHLKEKYAEQMTIVVQHQFWDLRVTESYFEIGLSFSDRPEKLHIPFAAIRGFYDPSVNFELEFDTMIADNEDAPDVGLVPTSTAEVIDTGEGNDEDLPAPDENQAGGDAKVEADEESEKSGAQVVSLDSFRKKS
jgi:hypothetical protein